MGNPIAGQFKPGQTNPAVAEKWAKALDLRKAGASYEMIARQVGYSDAASAYNAVQSALLATLREPADELRTLELERLDRIQLGLWDRARNGDEKAVDRIVKLMERRAKLLGLDAPTKLDHTSDGQPLAGVVPVLPSIAGRLAAVNGNGNGNGHHGDDHGTG